ncbi:LytR/AlgR family response regulator transcription factor [Flectobacillus rivi]|uniref:LytTR family DNA-binding domain-containing protein n=1 Tax=Flectobacillus rivi TaxID=2984209 RepID=A0ABT6YW31_9BACT|nr:LytTR family DNA-binding domain-containing protein [Flectobacillus rivi]MDI9873095.1 LytTR family DNA-binding domain-containing protein [Flectobacillus rivi]
MNCIILDDEPAAVAILERYIQKVPDFQHLQSFHSPMEALGFIKQKAVELVFLDIQMPDLLGTDLAKLLPKGTQVIFTTAFSDYAVEGFSLRAVDYLLKPISFPRFLEACNRALENRTQRNSTNEYFFVKDGHDWIKIIWKNVQFIQSDGNLLYIHEKDKKVITRMPLKDIVHLLPSQEFIRVHKSFIVSLSAIHRIERHQLHLSNVVVPIATTYKDVIEKHFGLK